MRNDLELAKKLIADCQKNKDPYLELGNCGITDLNALPELFKCVHLEILIISERWYEFEDNRYCFSKNNGKKNKLKIIPCCISKLRNLKRLVLFQNYISEITVLKELTGLQELVLDNNNISDINALSNLTGLQSLSLANNEISDITVLNTLKALQILSLIQNKITDFSVLGGLICLQELYLSKNKISDIGVLNSLIHLKLLVLCDNEISDISALENLKKLNLLNLSGNYIIKIPQFIFTLNMSISIDKLDWNNGLTLYQNPIEIPPIEIIKQGNKEALNYYKELETQDVEYLYEAKMLIVGEGGVGKTSLALKLINKHAKLPDEDETTKGIDILQKTFQRDDGNEFTINMWDFGGQEIYHSTHQFFLTKRSLYVLVDDTRRDDTSLHDTTFEYWLQTVELFGDNSPLLIVQNEKGGRSKDIDLKSMQGQFDFIMEQYPTNLKTNEGLESVKTGIKYHIQKLPHVGQKLPKKWVVIRKSLIKISEKQAYISWNKYLRICRKHNIKEKERAKNLSRYLHDLGTFLHFHNDPLLNKTIFLRNEWVTKAVYKLLDNEEVKHNKGHFTKDDTRQIWQDGYEDMHDELLALLLNFELCSQIPDTHDEYLIPNLLPESQPDIDWDNNNNLQLRYKYGFMPKGLLSRFIVRTHCYLKNIENAWKKGVLLERNNTLALVKELYAQNEIAIKVKGTHQKELLTIMAEEIDRINNSFPGIKVQKLIPCNCIECNGSNHPHFYRHQSILKRLEKGKLTVECDESYEDVSVIQLLDNLFDKFDNTVFDQDKYDSYTNSKAKKIFISYSHTNDQYLKRLETHLSSLRREGLMEDWNDTKFEPGDHWNKKIEEKLRAADIVILLVSADFIHSDFINDNELPIVAEMDKNGSCRVVPVIVESCDWETHKHFSHIQAYPHELNDQGKRVVVPIGMSQNPEDSYVQIVKAIRNYII
jgi:GTPase SAR1 family protein